MCRSGAKRRAGVIFRNGRANNGEGRWTSGACRSERSKAPGQIVRFNCIIIDENGIKRAAIERTQKIEWKTKKKNGDALEVKNRMVVEIKRYIKIEWKIKKNRMEDALEVKSK